MTCYIRPPTTASLPAFTGITANLNGTDYILAFWTSYASGTGFQLSVILLDLDGNVITTFLSSEDISGWTLTSSGLHLEITLSLHLLTNGATWQIHPSIVVYNLADGNTYLFDSLTPDYGTGDELKCWFTETISFVGGARYKAGTNAWITWEKVTLQ
jgi:hypothetical protein